MPQVPLVERHVLDADDPFVHFELDHSIDEEERKSVRKDSLDRRVIERERQVHRSEPIILLISPMFSAVNTTEQLTTLFALGREVTWVLDLDELLPKIPELIARLTKFNAFAVYLLDQKRNELTIAYSVG